MNSDRRTVLCFNFVLNVKELFFFVCFLSGITRIMVHRNPVTTAKFELKKIQTHMFF